MIEKLIATRYVLDKSSPRRQTLLLRTATSSLEGESAARRRIASRGARECDTMVASPPHASAHPALAAAAAAEHDELDDDTQSWAPAPRDVCAELLAKHKWSRTAESTQVRCAPPIQ